MEAEKDSACHPGSSPTPWHGTLISVTVFIAGPPGQLFLLCTTFDTRSPQCRVLTIFLLLCSALFFLTQTGSDALKLQCWMWKDPWRVRVTEGRTRCRRKGLKMEVQPLQDKLWQQKAANVVSIKHSWSSLSGFEWLSRVTRRVNLQKCAIWLQCLRFSI